MPAVQDLLSVATKPSEEALRLHPLYKGKVQIMPKCDRFCVRESRSGDLAMGCGRSRCEGRCDGPQ